jgi:hypothetical protein
MNRDVQRARQLTAESAMRELDKLRNPGSLCTEDLRQIADRVEYVIGFLERIPIDSAVVD